ncbi:MAG: hypothetical protein GY898_23680, partial [Proteobacteria bacterium]|nr:hypothetical protein [Pseudomonadota bacterium]
MPAPSPSAVRACPPKTAPSTAHFEIDLLKPVSYGEICARSRVTGESHRRIEAAGELFDAKGELIARGAG